MFPLRALLPFLVTLFTLQTIMGDKHEQESCGYLQCATKQIMGEKHCAAGGQTWGYCTCVEENGKKVEKYVRCEALKIFDLKQGGCVKLSKKAEESCGASGTEIKRKSLLEKIETHFNV
uniref:Putative 7.8 kDa secreted protein n=1 Tax=Culex tarsalis TaxID=7177 RepID=A0A1Q3EUQ7_CULTA